MTDTKQQQVLIRATPQEHQRWKNAAEKTGQTMSDFIRDAANTQATHHLDCTHPVQNRRWYPWAETCLKCGVQLRDNKVWLVNPDTFPHVRPPNANPAVQ
jgi:hypothetical protein